MISGFPSPFQRVTVLSQVSTGRLSTRLGARRSKNPARDGQAVGIALGELGKSRLSQNLNQFAKAVNMVALAVTPETEAEFQEACRPVKDMRDALIRALKDVEPT